MADLIDSHKEHSYLAWREVCRLALESDESQRVVFEFLQDVIESFESLRDDLQIALPDKLPSEITALAVSAFTIAQTKALRKHEELTATTHH